MQTRPSLPLEKVAAIDARLQAGLPRERVFAEAGTTKEVWERAQAAWLARMAQEALRSKTRKLHARYDELLRTYRKEALREQRKAAKKLPGQPPVPPVARLSPLAAQYRPPAAAEAKSEVSAARAPLPIAQPKPAPSLPKSNIEDTLPGGPVPRATLPFKQPAYAAPPSPSQPQAPPTAAQPPHDGMPPGADITETLLISGKSQPRNQNPLPFQPAAQGKPAGGAPQKQAAPQAPRASEDPEQHLQETLVPVGRSPLRATLPFTQKKEPTPAASSQSDEPFTQTLVPVNPAPKRDPLPFKRSPSAVVAAPKPADPLPSHDEEIDLEQTLFLPAHRASLHRGRKAPSPPLDKPPAPAPAATPSQPLSLAQYASLCAELAVFPGESARIFERYGLGDPALRVSADDAWRARLQSDAKLYSTWNEHYRHYHAYWSAQARKPGR